MKAMSEIGKNWYLSRESRVAVAHQDLEYGRTRRGVLRHRRRVGRVDEEGLLILHVLNLDEDVGGRSPRALEAAVDSPEGEVV